ncbi:hypothetical protein [Hufsiella ginkgonis]|uniref:Uncharacterized protein n=1 Tax=Hufsiella ginkgonis TaxID=2695274 RepID=A0A7K1XVM5_9SPHI|nr:hypothetical protein [Hufsiella ginkgonis]MXV14819.1 hypothetical protein [Hufsiella ginkgonis]
MNRKTHVFLLLLLIAFTARSQPTKIVADGKTLKSVSEINVPGDKILIAKVPGKLTLELPQDFYNYVVIFSNNDTTKDVTLTYDAPGLKQKETRIAVQSPRLDFTFSNGKLIAIGQWLLDNDVTIPVNKQGAFYVKIAPKIKPAAATRPVAVVKNICDLLTADERNTQERLTITPGEADSVFPYCFNPVNYTGEKNHVPFRFPQRYLLDSLHPTYATTTNYLLLYQIRQGAVLQFDILKLKRDKKKGFEYIQVSKRQFRPAAGKSIIIKVIGEKDSTYMAKVETETKYMEKEPEYEKQITPEKTAPATAKTDTASKGVESSPGGKIAEPAPYIALKKTVVAVEDGLEAFNLAFADIDFREKDYYTALACIKNVIRQKFSRTPKDGEEFAAIILAEVIAKNTPKKYYQDFCDHAGNIQQLYDLAINKRVKYTIFSQEMMVPDVDLLNVQIHTKEGKQAISSKQFGVKSGFKIDFSSGAFFSSLGNDAFVIGAKNFQYKEAIKTVDPSTGDIKTTYTGKLADSSRNVIYKNPNNSFGSGVLAHAYFRTGAALNVGLATGIFLNSAQLQGLVGPTIMLGNNTKRICISGGLALGQQTMLSAENKQFYYDGKQRVYNSLEEVPLAYSSSSSPATVNKIKLNGWFAAITYNLSSIKK